VFILDFSIFSKIYYILHYKFYLLFQFPNTIAALLYYFRNFLLIPD